MQVERVIEKRAGFTSELQASENTTLLLQNNQINRYYVNYVNYYTFHVLYSYGYLFPRNFLDDINEDYLYANTLESLTGFTQYNTPSIISDPYKYINRTYPQENVTNFYGGWLGDGTGLTSDGGTDRNISIVFALSSIDEANTRVLFSQRISSNRGYHIAFTDKRLYVRLYDSSGNALLDSYVTDELLEIKRWYHIVLTHNDNTVKVYLNGIKIKQLTYSGTIDYVNPFYLGNMLTGIYQFRGLMRSFWVGSEYLSDEQVFKFHKYFKDTIELTPSYKNTGYNFSTDYTGSWHYIWFKDAPKPGYGYWSSTVGDSIRYTFEAYKVTFYIFKEIATSAVLDIYLDGVLYDTVSTSGMTYGFHRLTIVTEIEAGEHTIDVEIVSGTVYMMCAKMSIRQYMQMTNNNDRYIEEDIPQTHFAIEKSLPRLIPRFEYDGFDETKLIYYVYLDSSDSNVISQNGAYFDNTSLLTERKSQSDIDSVDFGMKVGTFSEGGQLYTSDTPTADGNTERAISVWFKPSSDDLDGNYHSIVSQRNHATTNYGYHISIHSSGCPYVLGFNSSNATTISRTTTYALEADKWYNIILTHNTSTFRLYINGVLNYTGTVTAGDVQYSTQFFKFGAYRPLNLDQFNGQIAGLFLFSDYLTDTQVTNYYSHAKLYRRMLPDHSSVDMSELARFQMASSSIHKDIFLDKGQYYKITFSGTRLTVYGSYSSYGTKGVAYVKKSQTIEDYLYFEDINCYSSSYTYDVICDFIAEEFGTYTLEIYNTGQVEEQFIYISECIFEYGTNEIIDYSGRNNHSELINYSAGNVEITDGLNEIGYKFSNTGTAEPYLRLNSSMYYTMGSGSSFLFGMWFSPVGRAGLDATFALIDTYLNTEVESNDLFSIKYFQDITNSKDWLLLYGDSFISEDIDLGLQLDSETWYFLALVADNSREELDIILCSHDTGEIILDTTFSYANIGDQYPTSDIKNMWIGADSVNYVFDGVIDSVIFEGSTEKTIDDMKEYFYLEHVTNAGQFQDEYVNIDSYENLKVYAEGINSYDRFGTYYSKVYKLKNNKFSGYGKLIFTAETNDFTKLYDVQTRTSSDAESNSPTWTAWVDLGDNSAIESTNQQYLQFKFNLESRWDLLESPSVSKIEILDIDSNPYDQKAFSLPVGYDLDTNLKDYVVDKNIESYLVNELNGENYIEFSFPFSSDKRDSIKLEGLIQLFNDMYYIRKIEDIRQGNILITKVYAEAGFYNLQYAPPIKSKEFINATPELIIKYILSGTGWELDTTDIFLTRDFSIEDNSNCLELLRNIQTLFGGDLIFNSKIKKVYLYEDSSADNGVLFTYKKNVEISREQDSFDYVNRLYVYGAEGINISSLNNNLEYIDLSAQTEISAVKCKTIVNESITSVETLYNYALYQADKYKNHNVVYKISAKYLETNTNDLPDYNIGDIVTVYDKELDITLQTRIIKMKYNILNPYESELELSSKKRSLGDDLTEFLKFSRKFEKFNVKVMIDLMRQYMQYNTMLYGFINKSHVVLYNTSAQVTSVGIVKIQDTSKKFVNVLSRVEDYSPIVGTVKTGDMLKVVGEYGNLYKIQFYGINV